MFAELVILTFQFPKFLLEHNVINCGIMINFFLGSVNLIKTLLNEMVMDNF